MSCVVVPIHGEGLFCPKSRRAGSPWIAVIFAVHGALGSKRLSPVAVISSCFAVPGSKKQGEYHSSDAEQTMPAKERVENLRGEGKTDAEVAVILKSMGYNLPEMSGATGYNGAQLKRLRQGQPLEEPEEPAAEGGNGGETTVTVRRQTTGTVKGRGAGEGSGMSETDQAKGSITNRYQPTTERGTALLDVFSTVTGINPQKAGAVLKFYEGHQEEFDANPIRLMAIMQGAGLSWIKAQNLVQEWLTQVDPDSVFQPYLGGGGTEGGSAGVPPWMSQYMPSGARPGRTSFADRLDLMEEKMLEFGMMRQMMNGGLGGPGPSDEDQEEKRMNRQMNRMMMVVMMSNLGNKPAQQGQFGPGGFPFMPAEYEPLLDDEGKLVKDDTGNAIMRVRYNWPTMAGNGKKEEGGGTMEAIKYMAEAAKESANSRADMAEKFSSIIQTMSDKQFDMLQGRISSLEQSDPLEMVDTLLSRVKDWGFKEGAENVEVAKMNTDLKKWMHSESMGLQKWLAEQKMAAKDKEYARQQMKEFGQTIRTGIEKIGVPMAQAASDGFRQGIRGSGGNGSRGAGAARSVRSDEDLTKLSNDDLLNLRDQADTTSKTVDDAKKNVVAEINRRGLNV